MSRIIVRNLPEKINKEKLTELFSKTGTVTDIQLKYTKSGKFRKFAFLGFKEAEQANAAVNALNKTFINASQIQIEVCTGLGDERKPRAWSKHAAENLTLKTKPSDPTEVDSNLIPEKKKKKKDKKINDPKVEELIKTHKDDILFKEFIDTHLKNDEILWQETGKEEEKKEIEPKKVANQSISDIQYLKSKVSKALVDEDEKVSFKPVVAKKAEKQKLFTIKLIGLPYNLKKADIKKFLQPVKPYSIRRPIQTKGHAYCGFKTESAMKKALVKNKSFLAGKRITVVAYENKTEAEPLPEKWKQQRERLKDQEGIAESGRIFLRNLSYTVTEDEIQKLFESYGPISELVLPIDSLSRKPKGFGIVTFLIPEHACKAFNELDGTVFQGRMLHLLPGLPNKAAADESDGSFKQKKLTKQKNSASNSTNWNTFFISENALAEAMAANYNTSKENVLTDTKSGAAVRLALGETQIVSQTKDFLEENGVCLDSFKNMTSCPRSKTVILIKNLPHETNAAEIRDKFAGFGELQKFVMPPSGCAAIVEFIEPSEARKAFTRLAYSKFKHVPLYLEWAPEKVFNENAPNLPKDKLDEAPEVKEVQTTNVENAATSEAKNDSETIEDVEPEEGATIFVKNLNFTTNSSKLREHFAKCGRVLSATVAEKKDPQQPRQKLSLGYGFVSFDTKDSADVALKTMQLSTLEDHKVELKRSNRTTSTKTAPRKESGTEGKPSTKLLVRNVPFQATEKEIKQLFVVFGEIKALRLPKKMVGTGSHRGFCFVEYLTIHDAKRAFKALSQSTHLYGRRLVLEWAAADDDNVDTLREKTAQRFRYFNSGQTEKKKKKNITIDEATEED